MQPNTLPLLKRVARKEMALFFASPTAYLFLASFAAVSLFTFFWGESFFARNIADVRPLFQWMPILLIFLASTLTMRLWSDERRSGTLEHVLTQPVALWQFVCGKFIACLGLLAIALLVTLPLPLSISLFSGLDWGPIWAGYVATFLLGAAYLSIGLFVSARSDNQIVSLISSVALCGFFYLIGSKTLTNLVGTEGADLLRALGTGSRFDSIERGVLDWRDLYYYISIIGSFLVLNTLSLEKQRWAKVNSSSQHRSWRIISLLLIVNIVGANVWLNKVNVLRVDTTEGELYSISAATENYLAQLQEPLLIRGYFSSKTHPLLAPLVPQLRDLIKEYEIAGQGKVRVEFVDPVNEPDLEEEANQKYAIKPVPFQVADRYQSAIVSSYFDVLIKYGDEYKVLGFRDLIDVKARSEADIDVQLRNPEHDLTRAVKSVLQSYQAAGNLFDTVKGGLKFVAYISAQNELPKELAEFKSSVQKVVDKYAGQSSGRMEVEFVDPKANGGVVAKTIAEQYGFQPMATSLFSNQSFYFYLTLHKDNQIVQMPIDDRSEASFERNLASAIKRFASGFTKTVAFVAPQHTPNSYGIPGGASYMSLEKYLGAELSVKQEDLSDGRVSGEADILLLVAPKDLDEKQVFAVDQFLMQGGTVVLASSPYSVSLSQRNLSAQHHNSGLDAWLAHHGLSMDKTMVMDSKSAPLPVPVTRNMGGFQIQEMRMLKYPYFIDVRGDGLNADSLITADLSQLNMTWASPIKVDSAKQGGRSITELLHSSPDSWLSGSTDVMPKGVGRRGISPFQPSGTQQSQLLGVISTGKFDSFFADKQSPLLVKAEHAEESEQDKSLELNVSSVIKHSSESARIILFSSNTFLEDQILHMSGAASGNEYVNSQQLIANTVDWSLEDSGLLSIRSRNHFNRTLPPMERDEQLFWEYLNYALAILMVALVGLFQWWRKRARNQYYKELLAEQ